MKKDELDIAILSNGPKIHQEQSFWHKLSNKNLHAYVEHTHEQLFSKKSPIVVRKFVVDENVLFRLPNKNCE